LFSFGEKSHPFCAPLMSSFQDDLDLDLMKKGALLFKGKHNFKKYCTKPNPGAIFEREVLKSKIEENNIYKANFFPAKSYAYHIHSKGFMRYQVRLIMGQLFSLGRGEIGLSEIKESLEGRDDKPLRHIAPSSGLILNKMEFE
ncbi:MAG: tRNA pseudouridine(38-40) synthase TruA, partial [Desulfobacteraceae bacterium]|nr:tRNA pseudouridine(38-40) synthase TruA [Desulfobacteraceae bacterium]